VCVAVCVAVCCVVLQCVLQCVAVCCWVLHCVAAVSFIWNISVERKSIRHEIHDTITEQPNLIERNPPPRGGFLFTMFPHQEPWVRGPPSKHLVQILRGGSSYSRLLMREHRHNHWTTQLISPHGDDSIYRTDHITKLVSIICIVWETIYVTDYITQLVSATYMVLFNPI